MNLAAIFHKATDSYIYPLDREKICLRLFTSQDISRVELFYWERSNSDPTQVKRKVMTNYLNDKEHKCFQANIQFAPLASYLRYCFMVSSSDETVYFSANGFVNCFDLALVTESKNYFEFLWPNSLDFVNYSVPSWASEQVYYQIFPERFYNGNSQLSPKTVVKWGSKPSRSNFMGGDLVGIDSKLDYISNLGCTCLYLTPIFKAFSNHKYDTIDYFTIDPEFGTQADFRRLVEHAHELGIKIILDAVFNHCGYEFPYFQDVLKNGAASPYANWFTAYTYPLTSEPLNYDCVGHYKYMPKFNHANLDVQNYLIRVALYWCREFKIDGWRFDVADELPITFIDKLSQALKAENAELLLLGETWSDATELLSGKRLDSAMNYVFRDAVTAWLAKRTLTAVEFDERINKMLMLYPYEICLRMYNLIDSHDTERFLYQSDNNVTCLRLAVFLQMTLPGCPAIFYGDELEVSGANDPDCRQAMPWNRYEKENVTFNWYKQLISLYKNNLALMRGDFKTVYCSEEANCYAFLRSYADEALLCLINASEQSSKFKLELDNYKQTRPILTADAETGEIRVTSLAEEAVTDVKTGVLLCEMPANSVKVISLER